MTTALIELISKTLNIQSNLTNGKYFMRRTTTRILLLVCSSCILAFWQWHVAHAESLDLDGLKQACPGVVEWLEKHESTNSTSPQAVFTTPQLQSKLLQMLNDDQSARTFSSEEPNPAELEKMGQVDNENLQTLRLLVKNHGIPTSNEVGREGVHAFIVLILHVNDIQLQKRVLHGLSEKNVNASLEDIALLTDKIRVLSGHMQKYGTQFSTVDGKTVLEPVEDEMNLDKRREKMGMMPMTSYSCLQRFMESGGK